MGDEIRRVLALLAENKVTVDEADQLVRRFTDPSVRADATPATGASLADTPRFIRIQVQKPGKDGREPKAVNIRVPLFVVRGGLRLGNDSRLARPRDGAAPRRRDGCRPVEARSSGARSHAQRHG